MNNLVQPKVYVLQGGREPLSLILASRDCKSKSLTYWDEEKGDKGENRALRYAPNQRSPFMDEQDDKARLEHVVFTDGKLVVSSKEPALDMFLQVHPDNKQNGGSVFELLDHSAEAKEDNDFLDYQLEALNMAQSMTLAQAEGIMRVLKPTLVDRMDSHSIKRDVRLLARDNPVDFLEMADDPRAEFDNVVALAKEHGIIYSNSNDTEMFIKTKGDKKDISVKVPKGVNPIEAITNYLVSNHEMFKTVERSVMVAS